MTHPCPQKLARLDCAQAGVGFLCAPWGAADTALHLRAGGGREFPAPTNGTSFWVVLDGRTCCVRLEVVGRIGDVLTVVPPAGGTCACIESNARVRYAADSAEHMRAIAMEVGINVAPPLRFDCATRTLSIDCEELKHLVSTPCGI